MWITRPVAIKLRIKTYCLHQFGRPRQTRSTPSSRSSSGSPSDAHSTLYLWLSNREGFLSHFVLAYAFASRTSGCMPRTLDTDRAKLEELAQWRGADSASRFGLHWQIMLIRGQCRRKTAFERELLARGILFVKRRREKTREVLWLCTECASVGFCAIGPAVMAIPRASVCAG